MGRIEIRRGSGDPPYSCGKKHYGLKGVAGGRGFRTFRRACSAANWIEENLTEGRVRWLAKACEAHVFDFFLSVFSYRIDPKVPSVDIMLRADAVRPVKVPEVQYHCNATLPGQETF